MATLSSKVTPSGIATATQGTLADSAVQPNDSPTFAAVDVTGDITTDSNLVLGTTGNSVIRQDLTDKIMTVSGGSGNTLGANLRLYGEAHGSNPNNFLVRAGTSVELKYDDTASSWDFSANDITTTGDVTATAFAGDGSALTGISGSTTQGEVGTYAFAGTTTAADYAFGATIAGSSLRLAGITSAGWAGAGVVTPYNHGRQNTALSGTWRSMGRAEHISVGGGGRGSPATHYYGATLWVRIS
jgi:hypothetical protein